MKFTPSIAAVLSGAVVIVAVGFFAGRLIKPDPTPGYAFDLSSSAYDAAAPTAGLSKGGFSGFGETAGLPGQTLLSGKVASISATALVIEAADGTKTSIRLTNPISVNRIEPGSRDALRSGVNVVLRQAEDSGEIESVLVVGSP